MAIAGAHMVPAQIQPNRATGDFVLDGTIISILH
jgi:hypothetical protein